MNGYTGPQTLGEALIAEGNQEQADLLTEQGAALTREKVLGIINNVSWGDLTEDTLKSLRTVSVMRIKAGQPVFPWNDAEFFNQIDNEFHEGFVY